jgi:hypothetical protein
VIAVPPVPHPRRNEPELVARCNPKTVGSTWIDQHDSRGDVGPGRHFVVPGEPHSNWSNRGHVFSAAPESGRRHSKRKRKGGVNGEGEEENEEEGEREVVLAVLSLLGEREREREREMDVPVRVYPVPTLRTLKHLGGNGGQYGSDVCR